MEPSHTLLLASVVALFFGPFLLRVNVEQEGWAKALDSFALVAVGGLVVLHLIPDVLAHGGLFAAVLVLVGAALPAFMHRHAERGSGQVSALILLLGLAPHIALESAALGVADADHLVALGTAIVVHRLPVGLIVFAHLRGHLGARGGWGAIAILVVCALGGFAYGESLQSSFSEESFALLQALAAGMLLHVITSHTLKLNAPAADDGGDHCGHTPPKAAEASHCPSEKAAEPAAHCHAEPKASDSGEDHCHKETSGIDVWSSFGAFIGGTAVAGTLILGGGHEHGQEVHGLGDTFLSLALQSAPALLIAYVLAGLLTAFVTPARLQWLGGGGQGAQALKGVTFGLPLPICSCGVLPLYETLVRRGVPSTAAVAFLVATPELGLDAILLSVPLLGADLTLARVGAAFVVALGVALLVGRVIGPTKAPLEHEEEEAVGSVQERLVRGLRFGLLELFDSTMPWVLAGLLIAAWVEPVLGETAIHTISPYIQVPLFALIGIPLYVCAAGATPIAAIAIMGGVSPGAGIAFLLAGPATNVTTFGILSRLHSRRSAALFGLTMTLGAIGAGLAVDMAGVTFAGELQGHGHGGADTSWGQMLSLGGLAALFVGSLLRNGPRGIVAQISQPSSSH
jgi:uncharacterized membrane protein YraQ (UPF0718 family)